MVENFTIHLFTISLKNYIVPINDNKIQFTIDDKTPSIYNRMSSYVTID